MGSGCLVGFIPSIWTERQTYPPLNLCSAYSQGCHHQYLLVLPNLPQNKRFVLKVYPLTPPPFLPTQTLTPPPPNLSTPYPQPPSALEPSFASLFYSCCLRVMVAGTLSWPSSVLLVCNAKPHSIICSTY